MARRKTTTTRRSRQRSSKKNASPGWVWGVAGLSVGLLIAAFFWLSSIQRPGGERPPITAVNTPKKSQTESKAPLQKPPLNAPQSPTLSPTDTLIEPPPVDSKYDFYEMLPNQTVDVPNDRYRGKDKMQPLLQTLKKSGTKNKGQYILQAGSFRGSKDADRRKAQLALMGVESRIEKVHVNDGFWHRVRVGPFKNLQDANQLRTRLHSEEIQTMLVNTGK